MKKLISILLVLAIALGAVGCQLIPGNQPTEPPANMTPPADADAGADDGVGTDVNIAVELGAGGHEGGGVDGHARSFVGRPGETGPEGCPGVKKAALFSRRPVEFQSRRARLKSGQKKARHSMGRAPGVEVVSKVLQGAFARGVQASATTSSFTLPVTSWCRRTSISNWPMALIGSGMTSARRSMRTPFSESASAMSRAVTEP